MFLDREINFSERILVVDDDPLVLDFLSKAIKNKYDLIVANSAKEALDILKERGPFAVVISDLRMPEMDGITFLTLVKQRWPQAVRILFTGFADLQAATTAINTAHIFRLLTKPARNIEIIETINEGLKQHRLLVADEAQLIEREHQLRMALLSLPFPAMIHAEDGQVILMNKTWEDLSGWKSSDISSIKDWYEKAYRRNWQEFSGSIEKIFFRQNSEIYNDTKVYTKDGKTLMWDFNSAPFGEMSDGKKVAISIASDVTQRRAMEDDLSRARQVFENVPNGILITNSDGVIIDVNPAMCETSGFSPEELIGETPKIFKSGRHDKNFYKTIWHSMNKDGSWRGELWNRRKNGEIYPAWITMSQVDGSGYSDNTEPVFVAIITDISSLHEAQERIEYLSYYDALTGLPNQENMRIILEQALGNIGRQGGHVLAGYLDLDDFKLINESKGHETGDKLLVQVSNRLMGCVKDRGTVIRWGADQFVIIATVNDGEKEALQFGDELLDSLKESFEIAGDAVFVSACVGLSLYPRDDSSPNTLIQHANIAMNEAKKNGRNQFRLFSDPMNQRVVERLALETEMRFSLENNEFVLDYQPLVELSTGRVRGVEALVRWQNPKRGLMMPDSFLPVAEKSGLIIPLGFWVLEESCRQIKLWEKQGMSVERVAVNLSARQMWEENIVDSVADIISKTGCRCDQIELELTETVLMSSVEKTVKILSHLAELGIEVSMDDFGTGYSSLYYLRNLPFHIIKVDKSFVDDLPQDAGSVSLISSIIAFAHGLGKKTVVEGIETQQQLECVHSLGGDVAQGYYFARPMNPQKIGKLLASGPTPFSHMLPK